MMRALDPTTAADAARTIGAYAGLAALVVLVVLAVLYRKHARAIEHLADRAPVHPAPLRPQPRAPETPTARFDPFPTTARQRGEPSPRSRLGLIVAVIAALVVLAAIAIVALGASDSNDTPRPIPAPAPARVTPGAVRVRVFNTTGTAGLGKRVSDRLRRRGFRPVRPSNVLRARARTVVGYQVNQRAAARLVARALGIDTVQPVGPGDRRGGAIDVIVLVGSDQAP